MHLITTWALGVLSIGIGFYLLLGLAIPKFRGHCWSKDSAGVVAAAAAFGILLGLSCFDFGRPYTWIAALVAWFVGLLIIAYDREAVSSLWTAMKRRDFLVAFVLANIVSAALYFFLG
jgi:hypothetical protein